MSIRLYNTEMRAKEPLELREAGRVAMYVCGPTVYDDSHVGHARPAVVFDTIRRYLEYTGLAVTFISNITDIDDKIIARAAERGRSCAALASRYQDAYERDMAALGVRAPGIRPRATECIPEMIDLIQGLLSRGAAYATSRGVWFDVTRFAGYGRLSGRSTDDDATEHRVEQDPEKRHAQDFALWKFRKPDEPWWPSPWGDGRPGWHVECSAMAARHAKLPLDIHGGGADLCFPHHENELAQSEACYGQRFVRHWLHNGFITDGAGTKMGKSLGNAFWLREAFAMVDPAVLRMWILGTHYRMPLLYKPEILLQQRAGLARLRQSVERLPEISGAGPTGASADTIKEMANIEDAFRAAMDDDFNTPQALACLHNAARRANAMADSGLPAADLAAWRGGMEGWLSVLGLFPGEKPERLAPAGGGMESHADALVELLMAERQLARKEKNYAASDRLRQGLASLGIEVKDRADGASWSRAARPDN